MPVKTKIHHKSKKYPKHYAKVYWPYLPLILVMVTTLFVGHSFVNRSQRGVLAYATNVSSSGLLEATNKNRTSARLKSLKSDSKLNAAAQAKANDMARRNYWSHMTPEGRTPWTFINATGYRYAKAGENLAYGFATSKDVVKGWYNSAPHRANMLDSDFQAVGFGVAKSANYQKTGPETIIVALYAEPLSKNSQPRVLAPKTSKKTLGFNTLTDAYDEPGTQTISKAQVITGGSMPGIGFLLGCLVGGSLVFLSLSHGLHYHRSRKQKKSFHIKHPLRDATIVVAALLCILLMQAIGSIR